MAKPDKKPAGLDAFNDALRVLGTYDGPLRPGETMADGSVYIGCYAPNDRRGRSLSKTFNVFAAPEDLPEMTYDDLVLRLASLKNWHGYAGSAFKDDAALYKALASGSYAGGWIVPPRELLCGVDVNDAETAPDNLLTHMPDIIARSWHWSCTPARSTSYVWCSAGRRWSGELWNDTFIPESSRLECRPVRLVECKGPKP